MANLSANIIAVLKSVGYSEPFNFATMDINKVSNSEGFRKLSRAEMLEVAAQFQAAKQIVVPETSKKEDKEPTIGEAFAGIYRGSVEKGGYKVYGVPSKKTAKNNYLPQVGITLIPSPKGCAIKKDAFDKAEVLYDVEGKWSEELLATEVAKLNIVGNPDTTDAKEFIDSLVIKTMGIEFPLVEWLQQAIVPNMAQPKSFFMKQSKGGYITLVSTHYTKALTPFRG